MVTDEEIARCLAIFASRMKNRRPQRHHFYLLQSLVYLERDGKLLKLICSKPNTGRTPNGVSHYGHTRVGINIPCHIVDEQIPQHLQQLQVEKKHIPLLEELTLKDFARLDHLPEDEIAELKLELKKVEEKEVKTFQSYLNER